MHPAIRTQVDGLGEIASLEAGITTDEFPDMARQEFREEADINKLLARYGVNAPQRPFSWGELDFNLDLATAFDAIRQAKDAHATLPKELRQKYPTWQSLLNGLESGNLKLDLTALKQQDTTDENPVVNTEVKPS